MAKASYLNELRADKANEPYQSAYGILLSQRVAAMQVDKSKLPQGFEMAIQADWVILSLTECKSVEVKGTTNATVEKKEEVVSKMEVEKLSQTKHPTKSVSIEEVEDEEWETYHNRPKSSKHILIATDDMEDALENQPSVLPTNFTPLHHPTRSVSIEEVEDKEWGIHCNRPKSFKHILKRWMMQKTHTKISPLPCLWILIHCEVFIVPL